MNNEIRNIKRRKVLTMVSIVSLVIILLGSTYAFFTYSTINKAFSLASGSIIATFTEGTNQIKFGNAYPISDSYAISNLSKLTYVDFAVESSVSDKPQAVEYEIYLSEENGNTLSSDYVKLYLTDDKNNQIVAPTIYSTLGATIDTSSSNGKVIYKELNTGTASKNYRLYVWLDSSYEQNEVSQVFSFKVNLYAYNAKNPMPETFLDLPEGKYILENGTVYLSGSDKDINFNYVWYSGKMWRIVAINPDGSMKMITDDVMTVIDFGESSTYSTSYIKEWLNQEFLPTLYNYQNMIVTNSVWDVTSVNVNNELGATPPTYTSTVTEAIGLLQPHEYYMSFQNADYSTGYLSIGHGWFLITPSSTGNPIIVGPDNKMSGYSIPTGVRPVINLKSGIKTKSGTGSETDPYRLEGDISVSSSGLLSSRVSGEYVKIIYKNKDYLFRIVDIYNGVTKLVLDDYLRDPNNNLTIVNKTFCNPQKLMTSLWSEVDKTDTTTWRGYLNSTWFSLIDPSYNSSTNTSYIYQKGTYYLGTYNGGSYKKTVCSSVNSNVSIKGCIENGNVVSTVSTDDYVGLLRVGEMFATSPDVTSGTSIYSYTIFITPTSATDVNFIPYSSAPSMLYNISTAAPVDVRPTVHIGNYGYVGGSGIKNDPFIVNFGS